MKTLRESFKAAVEYMKETHDNGTCHWYLENPVDDDNDWAIVLGWADGFEEEPDDPYTDGTWRLCAKLAYQSHYSTMQCDYDTDWDIPYDEETGYVDDNEISIYPDSNLDEVLDWLLKCYENYKYESYKEVA